MGLGSMETLKGVESGAKDRIKVAAKRLFLDKGFAATSAREISEFSQVNLSLIYYYYGSKKGLFKYIVSDCFQQFEVLFITKEANTYSFDDMLKGFVDKAYVLLANQPGLPLFLLSSLKKEPEILQETLYTSFLNSRLYSLAKERNPQIVPIHFLWNLMGLVVYPFISANIMKEAEMLSDEEFHRVLDERKKMIPGWINRLISL